MPQKITGLIAFPITPAFEDGRIDLDGLQTLIARLVDAGVDGIGLLGSTGSYPYLSRAERRRAIEATVAVTGRQIPLMAGIGALSTVEAVALAADATQAGADFGLLAPVSYAPLTDEEVFGLFSDVAEAGLPLCIYNNPRNTRFDFTPELTGRIAALPDVVALKQPAPVAGEVDAAVHTLRAVVAPEVSVGFSVDWHAPAALLAGGDAWYSVVGGLFPRTALRLTRAAQTGDKGTLAAFNAELEPLWSLFQAHTSYRVMHHAATRLGIANAHLPRPLLPLSDVAAAAADAVLDALDLQ